MAVGDDEEEGGGEDYQGEEEGEGGIAAEVHEGAAANELDSFYSEENFGEDLDLEAAGIASLGAVIFCAKVFR